MQKSNKYLFFIIILLLITITAGVFIERKNSSSKKFEIGILSEQLKVKNQQLAKIQKKLSAKDINLQDVINDGLLRFDTAIFNKSINEKLTFSKFKTQDILFSKNGYALGSSYLEFNDNKIYLASGNGIFAYSEFNGKIEKLKIINSNIKNIVTYDKFYETSQYGIKDILIHEGNLYVSFFNEKFKDCYNLSILNSKLSTENLNFSLFYEPKKCIKKKNKYGEFWAHQGAGGRMVPYKNNQILFTTGDFRYRTLAQNKDSYYAKILRINLMNGKSKIVSMGHRNPQGIFYNTKDDYIISTEHGPKGGDEININKNPDVKMKNYGWPISSYGDHYAKHYSKEQIAKAPLHKSHKKFGFEEPIKYFVPSIGISEIIMISDELSEHEFLVGSMGSEIKEGDLSLHYIKLNKNKTKVIDHNIVTIGERIRDMIFIKEKKIALLFLETSSSIGILSIN